MMALNDLVTASRHKEKNGKENSKEKDIEKEDARLRLDREMRK